MTILDGRSLKKKILDELHNEVIKLNIKPVLVVIQVGNNEASNIYIRQKEKMAEYIGYEFRHLNFNEDISEEELILKIHELNNDNGVHGIIIQLPLPNHINQDVVLNAINPIKDVDGLTDMNVGGLLHNRDVLFPCTPLGVMRLLEEYNISLSGKNAVVIGRSNLAGKPMAMMLSNAGATVTLCHSKTRSLKDYTLLADILVVAVGYPNLITGNMLKDDCVVIDVGINKVNDKICGDVWFDSVKDKVGYITPVPGGVGQMTVAMLGVNVLKAYKMQRD